jgi:5,10-methenyltetrahydromethanopterin hydrogenase
MSDLKFEITNSDDKVIAKAARDIAAKFDPWGTVRPNIIAFIIGAIFMAALDFGDVWICAGDCKEMIKEAAASPSQARK